jgi:predicted kinase
MMLPSTYRCPAPESEELVTAVQHGPIPGLLRAGVDVIVDDTNLRIEHSRTLAMLAQSIDAPWECVDCFLEVPVEEGVRRDAARSHPVGEWVIRGMWDQYLSDICELPAISNLEPLLGRVRFLQPSTETSA